MIGLTGKSGIKIPGGSCGTTHEFLLYIALNLNKMRGTRLKCTRLWGQVLKCHFFWVYLIFQDLTPFFLQQDPVII